MNININKINECIQYFKLTYTATHYARYVSDFERVTFCFLFTRGEERTLFPPDLLFRTRINAM